MAESTPPSILRERLRKTKEINDFLENELTEICEFTMYEKQLLLVEQGCSELVDKNRQLQDEIQNLSQIIQSQDDVLNGVKNKIQQKKIRFTRLLSADSSTEGAVSPSALINEVLSTFDALSKYIENDVSPEEARRNSSVEAVEQLNVTNEELQNELSKLRLILETGVEEGARRFSDSMLIQEKLKSRASLFGSKEIAVQTNEEGSTPLVSVDISNVGVNDLDSGRTDNLILASSNAEELERKLLEIREQCQALSSANEDLEKLLSYKEDEIQKLNKILNIPKSPCTCRKSTLDQDLDYEDETLSCPIQPVIESFHGNSSSINNSFLPTIPEVKESSFDGSFDENNVPDFTSPPSAVCVMMGTVESEINLDAPQKQSDRALLERYRTEIADLQKCRDLLAGELEYCLLELDYRDEQITLLQSTLPVAHNLCAGITASSDLFKQCNEEIESLEILVDESEGNVNNELNTEVTGRLVNVLDIIQKGIDTVFAVSMYRSSDPQVAEASFANMSSTSLANVSSYPQQFCSVLLDSTVNLSVNDSAMISPNVALRKPDTILKDVRNLRKSIEVITSDFTREFFNIISKLERVESIILWFRNMDSDEPVASVDMTKPIPLTSYRNVLIEDIKEKARLILDLQKPRSYKQCKDSSQGVSAQSSDESLIKADGSHGPESVFSYTDSSVYASATDGDEANLHFMCPTDSKCDIEIQTSFVCSDVMLSTMDDAFDCCGEDSQRSDKPNENMTADQEGCKNILEFTQSAETILSAFWKTVNDFNALLQGFGIPTSKTVLSSGNETLTLEKIESYAGCVREVLTSALSREPLFCATTDEKDNYDPDCTELLSLDITSLNEDNHCKKPLLTSALLPANQNIIDVDQEEKENSFCDGKVALNKAVKNWEKLIHDSNKRIAELLQSKNNIKVRLSEKIADNNNLVQQLNKARSDVESHQHVLREKTGLVEDLTALIANKNVQLDNIKSEVSLVQEEASKLRLELKNTKESWNLMVTDFMNQYQDLSVKIDSFQTEINDLQKEKLELDSQLKSSSTTIKELRTDLLNKEQLQTSLEAVEERLAKEVAENEVLDKNLHEVTELLATADMKVVDLEREISSLNDNLLDKDKLRTSLQMVEGQLAKESAQKEELENNLQEVTDRLSSAENKVTELEVAILDQRNHILELQDSNMAQNEHQDRIANLEHSVSTLTVTLEKTRASWNTLILSSSAEIDQLKTSLKTVEVQLAKELAKKTELENALHDVKHKLFTAHEKVSDLERRITSVNENLLEKDQLKTSLEMVQEQLVNKVTEREELQENLVLVTDQLSSAEKKVADLEREITAVNEKLLDKDQLGIFLQKVEEQLAKEMAEKKQLHKNLQDVTDQLYTADKKVSDFEREITALNGNLLDKDQLKDSLQTAEEQLTKELAEKEELQCILQSVTGQLSIAEKKVIELEEVILDKTNRIQDSQMAQNEHQDRIANLEQSVTTLTKTLEKTRASWNTLIVSSSTEIDQLKTYIKSFEVQLAKELANKLELENMLHDIDDKLSSSEKRVSDLEGKITDVNETLLEKVGVIRDLEAREIGQNEYLIQIAELQKVVDTKTSALDETKLGWNESIKSYSAEIDQLKASLKMAEEQLVKVVAEKEIFENISNDVAGQLSFGMKAVSDLERELSDTNQVLVEKNNYIGKLEGSLEERDEYLIRNKELENYNNDLVLSLHITRENWNKLMESSRTEIDRLTVLCRSLSYQLSVESLKCKTLSGVSKDYSTKMAIAEETIRKREVALDDLNAMLCEKENQILQLHSKYGCLSNNFQTLMLNCKESFRQHDQLLKRIEMELGTTSLEKETLSNRLEEALGRFEGIQQTLMEKEDNFSAVLMEQEKLFSDKFVALDDLEGVVSNLRSQLSVAQDNRKKLILEAKKRIDEVNTSKKRAEVQVMLEIVERKKVSTKLDAAVAEKENLREGLRINECMITDMKNILSTLKCSLSDDEEALNQTNNIAENDAGDARNELMQLILYTKEKFSKLCEAERSLSLALDKEKASNIQLSSELYNVLSSSAELKGKIRSCPSSVNDTGNSNESSLSSFISDPLIKSSGHQNQSVDSHTSLSNEDEFEVTTYNATVHLEQSVFVSDLVPMERTVNGDGFDPLSMSIIPQLTVTPRKKDAGTESSDESEFGTPLATRWGEANSSDSPRQVGTDQKTPDNDRNISVTVTKNLAHLAAIEENAELQEKIKTYETDLVSLQAKVEETSTLHEQLNQRIITIQNLVDGVLRVFYNRVPELPMEQNIVNISKDITNLTEAIIESTGSVQNCLMDSVSLLITDGLPASSHIKDSIASTNSKIGAIAKDCFTLKKEMLVFSQLLATELTSASSSINSSVEQNISSLGDQITLKNAAIEELKNANDTLQNTLLAASLEKESLRGRLNDEISHNNSLKCSIEEKEKEFETKQNTLREECDENLIRRNNIESIILELLRQWNGDEEVVSEDVVQELKLVFGEAVQAKNTMKAHTNKTINFNFMKGVEEIISKNESLKNSLSCLKSQLSQDCKTLSTGIKNIQNENKNLLLDFTSSKNEIKGALHRALCALNVLGEESLQNLSSKDDAGVLKERLKECQDRISNYETAVDEATSKCSSLTAKVKLLEENNSSLSTANEAMIKDVSDSETINKELIGKLEELNASNRAFSSEMAKLQGTILELNEKLSANQLQLSECQKQKFQVSGECSLCGPRELELESIRKTLISVIASTVGKPIDLSSSRDEIVEKLTYIKLVLSESNDTLHSVMKLLNSPESSGVIALECLHKQLKSDNVRDVHLCKKKIADEIHCMDVEMRIEELVQLSLLELHSKFVSVIMEREDCVISGYRKDYESKLASKAHQLSQYEDKEKYLNEMIEDLTKENEKLEETLSNMRSQNVRADIGHSKATIGHLEKSIINKEENKILTEEIETLYTQISALKSDAAESTNKFKVWSSDLETILKNFSELLRLEESVPSSLTNCIEFDLKDKGFPNQLVEVLRGMFSRLSDVRKLFVGITEKSKEDILAVEHLNTVLSQVENEHAVCKETELKLEELHKELTTKEGSLSKLSVDYANLETQLNELKKSIVSKDEVVAALTTNKASLELELEQSKKYVDELKSRQIAVTTRSRNLNVKLKGISSQHGSIKAEFLAFQNETMADNMKILSCFQNLCKQINGLVEDEKNKVRAYETEVKHLHGQLSALNVENGKLANEKRDLESSLVNLSAEKQSLGERLKKLEDVPARTGHDDKSCPYKEKVQEYRKELWIIRQKSDDEQKKFDVMKKNIEEDLAFKANIIKKLEERNENAVSQFNLRLASSTTSYNQVCKKLEEAEEKISFLRDMNSQDKKHLEKDIDNLKKELSKLQSVKTFVEGLNIDCNKLQETLPEIKKRLSEYENLQTTWNEMVEKNKELEEECEFMNKQIQFLETRNTEMYKQCMEVTENSEKLKKELADNLESMKKLSEVELKNNQLQNEYKLLETNLESRNQKIIQYMSEMKNYESMLTERTKMNQEVRLALEEERAKYADLALKKLSVEKNLIALQKDLGECHARLKELGCRLETAADVEASLHKVSAERDEALRLCSDLKSKLPMAQQLIREKENLVEALRSSHEKLVNEKKENEDILKARERELVAKIEVLKTEASDKAVRIVQLESIMESSQTVTLESFKAKISSLEIEVETLKKELSRSTAHMSPRPQHVTVEAEPLTNKLETKTRAEFERAIHKLEKNQIVLKRLCKMRREKMLEYENLLRNHNIHVPASTDHSL